MTSVKERAINIINMMPEAEVEKFVTMYIRYENPENISDEEFTNYKAKMKKSQQWAKEAGMVPDDITKAIKAVRQEKRQQG